MFTLCLAKSFGLYCENGEKELTTKDHFLLTHYTAQRAQSTYDGDV